MNPMIIGGTIIGGLAGFVLPIVDMKGFHITGLIFNFICIIIWSIIYINFIEPFFKKKKKTVVDNDKAKVSIE